MTTAADITADAIAIGLRPDADNGHARLSHVAPAVWFWGTRAQCRRLAAVRGWDITSTPHLTSTHADLRQGERIGFIGNPIDGVPEYGIRLGLL